MAARSHNDYAWRLEGLDDLAPIAKKNHFDPAIDEISLSMPSH